MVKRNVLMKILIKSILFLFFSLSLKAQDPLETILKSYFRIHPFDIRFSSFINSLQADPWFTTELFERRNDSTFFYLSGIYKNFNPFKFSPKEVRLILAEDQIVHNDSLKTLDTIINLQIIGVMDSTASSQSLVKKEFSRFLNKYASRFWKTSYDKYEKESNLIWELTNFFVFPFSISPITVAWGTYPQSSEYVFTITIRLKVKENMAGPIISPEGF